MPIKNKNPATGCNQLRGCENHSVDVHMSNSTTKGNNCATNNALADLKPSQLAHLTLIRTLLSYYPLKRKDLAERCSEQHFKAADTAALIDTMVNGGQLKQTVDQYGNVFVELAGGES